MKALGYIASIFVMITVISNNEYKAQTEKKHLGGFLACALLGSRVQNTSMCAEEPGRAQKKLLLIVKPGFPCFCRWHALLLVVLSIISANVQPSNKSNYCLTLFYARRPQQN